MLILGATPCASILLNLAEMHNSGQNLAANCALLSTLLSMLTIPLLSLLL
jgi:predicted permease